MFKLRKAIEQFKTDFKELDERPSSSLHSDTSSSRTTSDDLSRHRTSPQNIAIRDLPAIPLDDSNDNEAVTPLQKKSLFKSLQHNPSLVSPNQILPPIESGPSRRERPESLKSTAIVGGPIPVDPMSREFTKVSALLNSSKKKPRNSISSNHSSVPSIEIFPPATHSEVLSEASQQIFFNLPPSFWKASNPSSKITNGNAVSSTPLVKEMLESFSNSTSHNSSEADDRPMESIQSPVTQTSRQSSESSLHNDDSVIQTTFSTVINDNNDQHTSETKERSDPIPTTQPLPFTSTMFLERESAFELPIVKREHSVPGDFPLPEPFTPSSVQSPPMATKTLPDSNPTSPKDSIVIKKVETRRKPSLNSLNPFLLAMAVPPQTTSAVSAEVPEKVEQTKTPWRPKPLRLLQSIGESSDSLPTNGPSAPSPDDIFATEEVLAGRMKELGRMRRMESRNQLAQFRASREQPNQTTATPIPQLHTLHEDKSSDVTALLREAYLERQQELQTQLDKALAELRDVKVENKRLTDENQSQRRSMLQLKTSLDEAKQAQENSSAQIKNQLRVATTSLTILNKEKKGWQDKLDSMQHKLSIAERQVRCLDHLTRYKLESRQEAAYGQPKRRGLLASTPASTDVIGTMGALNEEIYQTCVQLVEGLERMRPHSNKYKLQAQKVLGDHLTAMLEAQATGAIGSYNMLIMQAVLEVFMVHWCSSIIEAFYPKQESFADLLIQLSAKTTRTPGSTAICGKQIQIVQPSTPYTDNLKFKEWVKEIMKELGWFLTIGGLRVKPLRGPVFSTKILALVNAAYELRTAMAEKDICGGLDVVIVSPDTPFQEDHMKDAHANPRKGDADQSHVDFVAGTSGIGLHRKTSETVNGQFQSKIEVVLKPKVILTRALSVND